MLTLKCNQVDLKWPNHQKINTSCLVPSDEKQHHHILKGCRTPVSKSPVKRRQPGGGSGPDCRGLCFTITWSQSHRTFTGSLVDWESQACFKMRGFLGTLSDHAGIAWVTRFCTNLLFCGVCRVEIKLQVPKFIVISNLSSMSLLTLHTVAHVRFQIAFVQQRSMAERKRFYLALVFNPYPELQKHGIWPDLSNHNFSFCASTAIIFLAHAFSNWIKLNQISIHCWHY